MTTPANSAPDAVPMWIKDAARDVFEDRFAMNESTIAYHIQKHAPRTAGREDIPTQCPECGGQGWWAKWDGGGNPPEQVQCEKCYGEGTVAATPSSASNDANEVSDMIDWLKLESISWEGFEPGKGPYARKLARAAELLEIALKHEINLTSHCLDLEKQRDQLAARVAELEATLARADACVKDREKAAYHWHDKYEKLKNE